MKKSPVVLVLALAQRPPSAKTSPSPRRRPRSVSTSSRQSGPARPREPSSRATCP